MHASSRSRKAEFTAAYACSITLVPVSFPTGTYFLRSYVGQLPFSQIHRDINTICVLCFKSVDHTDDCPLFRP
jgi:hypothetical protein